MAKNGKNYLWTSENSYQAMEILERAHLEERPVILLTGAGISVDSGFPLAAQLKEYLVQVREYVIGRKFLNVRQYIEEARWPSRHDLRIDLLLQLKKLQLDPIMAAAERKAVQAALVAELRDGIPTLASSLQEIFLQLDEDSPKHLELMSLYGGVRPLAESLGRRSPKNIAYRSLLFHLCDNNQATIDACFDHFIRDRTPTTTHQFIYFLTRALNVPVIFTTNFDPLLELAFAGEGMMPRVYEVQGEGSIPSARLLLSQPLSIVKLHGGAHHMQTGFDLDKPLSPAALSSFAELYTRLGDKSQKQPLTLVIGYSGSDRRVMDIVGAQVREWRKSDNQKPTDNNDPNVLWISRDTTPPELLASAVEIHPDILQQNASPGKGVHYPVHLVKYRDGRLFLLEALQKLLRHFPIARSNYQAVNFVPHSVAGKSLKNFEKFLHGDWRVALAHTNRGGGSSSTLVDVAWKLDQQDYKTIWIDLTEVAGVPALIDLVSERISKLDSRLPAVRRPPLLRSLLQNDDKLDGTPFAERSRKHEFLSCVQWLRMALRRGKYLLALDSLDEFPSEHPALQDEPVQDKAKSKKLQRKLMCDLIKELASEPDLIGDSRIIIALSSLQEQEANEENVAFVDLAKHLEDSPDSKIRAPLLESVRQERTHRADYLTAFKRLERGEHREDNLIKLVIVLISCSARRIRSEVLLRRCVAEVIGRLLPGDQKIKPVLSRGYVKIGKSNDLKIFENLIVKEAKRTGQDWETKLWNEPSAEKQHRNHEAREADDNAIMALLEEFSGHKNGARIKFDKTGRQWLYRTEGGYHWMHRDIRNNIYQALKDGENRSILAMSHHVIALFCYDELYERSRDARAFLEYLFHRIAAIRLAIDAKRYECALNWSTRLLISLHREKHALLTRVRLPGFLWQMVQLRRILEKLGKKCRQKKLRTELDCLKVDLFRLLSDFFLASGHPHSALSDSLNGLVILGPASLRKTSLGICERKDFEKIKKFAKDLSQGKSLSPKNALLKNQQEEKLRRLTALRDVAYSCHEPLLSTHSFPSFPKREQEAGLKVENDWVETMKGKGHVNRLDRLNLCKKIYGSIAVVRKDGPFHELDKLKPWTEHDDAMDFFGGLVRKVLEFDMLQTNPTSWIDSSKVYLRDHKDANDALQAFRDKCSPQKKGKTSKKAKPKEDPLIKRLRANMPLLRRSGKRLRHECYRLCLDARKRAASFLAIDQAGKLVKKILNNSDSDWGKIRRSLTEAESILNRSGGPADRQAMAITRLTSAELHVRRAEVIQWLLDDAMMQKVAVDKKEELQLQSEKSLNEAFTTLSTVEQLMNEGRGENRWRFFYLLTLARAHLLRAYRNGPTSQKPALRSAFSDMAWAARHLAGAINNCGLWTDRYDVLLWWWDTWKEVARQFHPNGQTTDFSAYQGYLSETYARFGIRWGNEKSASRFSRWEIPSPD